MFYFYYICGFCVNNNWCNHILWYLFINIFYTQLKHTFCTDILLFRCTSWFYTYFSCLAIYGMCFMHRVTLRNNTDGITGNQPNIRLTVPFIWKRGPCPARGTLKRVEYVYYILNIHTYKQLNIQLALP